MDDAGACAPARRRRDLLRVAADAVLCCGIPLRHTRVERRASSLVCRHLAWCAACGQTCCWKHIGLGRTRRMGRGRGADVHAGRGATSCATQSDTLQHVKARILVVEDEPAISDNIQFVLESEGLQTVRVATGLAAIPVLDEGQVDLIVLDIGLPDINGLELLKDIRRTRATPIILLTARTAEIDRVLGLELGADDYVAKPFSPRELAARVKAVLRRYRPGPRA